MKSNPIEIRATTPTHASNCAPGPTDDYIHSLMDGVASNKKAAEEELRRLLQPGIEFFVRHSVSDRSPMEGGVQEVLRLVVVAIETHAVETASQLLTFAVRQAKGYRLVAPGRVLTMDARRNVAAMRTVLEQTPRVQREAFAARFLGHKRPEQIAFEFGISPDELKELSYSIRTQYQRRIGKPPSNAKAAPVRRSLDVA